MIMKNVFFLVLAVLVSSCGMQQLDSSLLIYTPNKVHLSVMYFHDGFGKSTSTSSTPLSPEMFQSTYYMKNGKSDDRPFFYEVCRLPNNPLDTIKLFFEDNYTPSVKYSVSNYDECYSSEVVTNEIENQGKNYPSISEFMDFVKLNYSEDYYEILPSEECLMIE